VRRRATHHGCGAVAFIFSIYLKAVLYLNALNLNDVEAACIRFVINLCIKSCVLYIPGMIRKFAEKYCYIFIILYISLKMRMNIVIINVIYTAKFQKRTLTISKFIVTKVTLPSQHRPSIY